MKKGAIARAKARLREMKETRAAKRRARERGKRGVTKEVLGRIDMGILAQELAKLKSLPEEARFREFGEVFKRADERFHRATNRMVVKTALDRFGIVNTKKDPSKRQRIQGIMEEVFKRIESLEKWEIKKSIDPLLKKLYDELAKELGGKVRLLLFAMELKKVKEEMRKARGGKK